MLQFWLCVREEKVFERKTFRNHPKTFYIYSDDDTQWLVYWTTYGTLSMLDFFADRICAYFPLFWPLKAIFLLYLALPQTLGAHNIYVKYLDPAFDKLAK